MNKIIFPGIIFDMGIFNRTKDGLSVMQPRCRHERLEVAEYSLHQVSQSDTDEPKLRLSGLRRCRLCLAWIAPDGKAVAEDRLAELLRSCGNLLPWQGGGQIQWGTDPVLPPGSEKGQGDPVAMASAPRYHLDEVVLAFPTAERSNQEWYLLDENQGGTRDLDPIR